jgi:hypothetical protein
MASPNDTSDLQKYYDNLRNEIRARLNASEEGSTQEQTFTQYAIDLLAEAGETENARECRDEKVDKRGYRIHQINGYSLSENLETVQLFHTIYKSTDEVSKTYKAEIDGAVNASTRFLKNALNGYFEEMEVTAPAFDFARELGKNGNDIERAEIFILTDGECEVDKPEDQQIRNVLVMYRIVDVRYLMRLEGGHPEPIEIDFEQLCGRSIPCLTIPVSNDDYQSYLAVVPGDLLADVYKRYGARLLEMNVRSFLQFNGKINKGIRETILKEPHMFLAFNNGIAATAEEVELIDLPGGGKAIKKVHELQIVNGGQTTASILHTRQKDKAGVDRVFVQMKLSVIKNRDEISSIVNRISRYANSQNKVSDADLTANSPFHIEIEKLSRIIWAPPKPGSTDQTRWFYERARGQYNNELSKQITPKQKANYTSQTPKSQMLVKEDLAKYVNLWARMPYHVVRGNQKNYVMFMASLKKRDQKPDSIFFEDLIAKAILFRAAEKIYGVKPNAIGDMRYITVPYTIAYLNQATDGKLDLLKIWKQQGVSDELKTVLPGLMRQIEDFIKTKAPGSLYGEWAKKEECWQTISTQRFSIDLPAIKNDLIDPGKSKIRYSITEDDTQRLENEAKTERLQSLPPKIWRIIETWGQQANRLTFNQRDTVLNLARKIESKRPFTESELNTGIELIEKIIEEAPELLVWEEEEIINQLQSTTSFQEEITIDLVQKIVAWDRKHQRLKPHHFVLMKRIAEGTAALNDPNKRLVKINLEWLKKFGFRLN